uniref:Odorant binding protein n=1 Tax=Hippodamia variegata TaxID=703264 RepID=A0A9E9NJG7_9CUCU|nr:odorant binding protein [Hippodamia variegata]
MHAVKLILYFGFLVQASWALPTESHVFQILFYCRRKASVPVEDLINIHRLWDKPSNNLLCYMKCVSENDGSLKKNGEVNEESLDKFLKAMEFDEVLVKKVKECVRQVPLVKTCEDMRNLTQCYPDLKS